MRYFRRGRHRANRFSPRVADLQAHVASELLDTMGMDAIGPLHQAQVKIQDGHTLILWDASVAMA